ncbi:potassium channel family protein [Pantoea agglomerans]|uniref:potassium channel family protein n=1 Tax=Enterobacter agglomerans TaxID=549 RepID=UPI0012DB0637|nr:potassium channel family protein [Pantoea agglomerans]
MSVLRNPLLYFILLIIIFAFLYRCFWDRYPDSFVKNDYLNSTPVENASRIAYGLNPEINDGRYFSQSTLYAKSNDLVSEHNEIILIGLKLRSDLNNIGTEEGLLIKRNEAILNVNYNQYINDSAKDLNAELVALLTAKGEGSEGSVAVAQLKLNIALKMKEANDYAFEHRAEFNDKKTWSEIQEKNLQQDRLRKAIDENEKRRIELQKKAEDFLINRDRSDITLLDFFYYSVGISTTTTFGDIMASSPGARGMVTFQLLISIFILAFATSKVVTKLQKIND